MSVYAQILTCRLITTQICCMLVCVCVCVCVLVASTVFMYGYAWPPECLCACVCVRNTPSQYYEEVQAVPRVSKVTLLAKNPQSHHLDHHLNGKERKDEVIKVLHKETDTEKHVYIIMYSKGHTTQNTFFVKFCSSTI